jgi:hypothetical protein
MRARNIKPGFFENEQLAELPFEARLLFAGLWCYSDREGRFEWRPKRIKALLFPYDTQITPGVIEGHLMSLHAMTLILQYKSGDYLYGVIPNFTKHQHPHPHEAKSELPDPIDYVSLPINYVSLPRKESLLTIQNPNGNQCHGMSVTCQEDIRILGLSDSKEEPLAPSLPESPIFLAIPTNRKGVNFPITEAMISEYTPLYPAINIKQEVRAMKAWAISNPSQRKTARGMRRFINSWLSRAQNKFHPGQSQPQPSFMDAY